MAKIEYTETDRQGLDLVGPLWQKLNEHHKLCSRYFSEHYPRMTFDQRKKELLDKSRKGAIRIDLARDADTGELVGYCISTVTAKRQGEIDSIYVEDGYRHSGVGDNLVKRTLDWMKGFPVTRKKVEVIVGNKEAFAFYERYNFRPRSTVLEQVEVKEVDKS